jgi:hypothetical protein
MLGESGGGAPSRRPSGRSSRRGALGAKAIREGKNVEALTAEILDAEVE